jgi:prepilin-type N-terminal cleavage/methylation domain-containing protein
MKPRGFTLIELMVIVVIVGVLATIGTYGVIKYVRVSKTSEAYGMILDIKASEEAVMEETFQYTGLNDYTSWHPSDPPGDFKASWSRNTGEAKTIFNRIGVKSPGNTYFTYTVVAGAAGDNIPTPPINLRMTSPSPSPFYVVVAKGDLDGDGLFSYAVGNSFGSNIRVENEGE